MAGVENLGDHVLTRWCATPVDHVDVVHREHRAQASLASCQDRSEGLGYVASVLLRYQFGVDDGLQRLPGEGLGLEVGVVAHGVLDPDQGGGVDV